MNMSTSSKEISPRPEESQLPPEEGRQGWLCLVGSFLCLFCSFGFLNAIGIFQATYEETLLRDYSPSSISWIFAVQVALMWAPGPLFGRVIDTYGPAPVLYPGCLLAVLGLCMTSLAHEYYQIFLAQGLCFGLGAGAIFTSAMVCVGQWFVRRRGLAAGIATSGSSLGGVVFPIFLHKVMSEVGFYTAVRYVALLVGILLAIACLLVRRRLPVKKWNGDAKWMDMRLLKETSFASYTFGCFCVMWGLWAPFDYLTSMAMEKGFSTGLASYLISILNAASIPGRILPPHLADKLGHFNMLTTCSIGTGASMLVLWLPFNFHPSHAGIIVFSIAYGFFSGGVVSLVMPCAAKMGDLATLGQRFGTFQLIISVSSLTGMPLMGAILRRQGDTDFSGLQIFAGVACLVGAGFLALSTRMQGVLKGTTRV